MLLFPRIQTALACLCVLTDQIPQKHTKNKSIILSTYTSMAGTLIVIKGVRLGFEFTNLVVNSYEKLTTKFLYHRSVFRCFIHALFYAFTRWRFAISAACFTSSG